jgi:hypothetical protein
MRKKLKEKREIAFKLTDGGGTARFLSPFWYPADSKNCIPVNFYFTAGNAKMCDAQKEGGSFWP